MRALTRPQPWLTAAAAACLLVGAHAAAAAPELAAAPDRPGADAPPAGRSLLRELFPDGPPAPFAALLGALRARAGAENVATALIPLGRSLQRLAAHPDYFASPRVVVAVTGDRAAGPEAPRLGARLFLGYQPAAEVIEAISYNATAGRFEFEEVVGYGDGPVEPRPAERRVCVACHQGQGPIFARPLWAESNADPRIAGLLAFDGAAFHGAPRRQTVDALDALDRATDAAARVAASNRLWAEGCAGAACRATLLAAAVGLHVGAAPGARPAAPGGGPWPEGLGIVSPDLPNRDPLLEFDPAGDAALPDADGALDPETPRAAATVWQGGFASAAMLVAERFTDGDRGWLDGRLARLGGRTATMTMRCARGAATVTCRSGPHALEARLGPDGAGRLERVAEGGRAVRSGVAIEGRGAESVPSAAARLVDGRRIVAIRLTGDIAELRLVDDLEALAERLAAAAADGAPTLGAGPFDRRAVLRLIEGLAGGADG